MSKKKIPCFFKAFCKIAPGGVMQKAGLLFKSSQGTQESLKYVESFFKGFISNTST
jgi:hypothetical protein